VGVEAKPAPGIARMCRSRSIEKKMWIARDVRIMFALGECGLPTTLLRGFMQTRFG
jgi:hypothetical protein